MAADFGFSARATKTIKLPMIVVALMACKEAAKKTFGGICFRDKAGQILTGQSKRPNCYLTALEEDKSYKLLAVMLRIAL